MKTTTIKSFEQYIEYTEKYKNKYLFRGQANVDWSITPSLFRNDTALDNEIKSIKECEYFEPDNILTSIFKMQHYGIPTRLLDLTISPLAALFFAIDDDTQKNNNGVVYVIDRTKSISFNESEIIDFSKLIIDETILERPLSETEIACLTSDYIVDYDYRFSYSNNRAILQGGTALIVGFDIKDDIIYRNKEISLEPYLIEKFIIPSDIKQIIREKLNVLGYSNSILYESFETVHPQNIKLSEYESEVTHMADFYKVIATYKVNTISFNKDDLILEIKQLYNELIFKHGMTSRIWLFFYFDQNDLEHSNWICRVEWNKEKQYNIVWIKDYFKERLRHINEEISQQELISRFQPFICKALSIEDKVRNTAESSENYDVLERVIYDLRKDTDECFRNSNDIPFGDYTIEPFAKTALNYICEVDRLIRDTIIFIERKKDKKFIRYWIQSVLKDCQKARTKLEQYSEYYN